MLVNFDAKVIIIFQITKLSRKFKRFRFSIIKNAIAFICLIEEIFTHMYIICAPSIINFQNILGWRRVCTRNFKRWTPVHGSTFSNNIFVFDNSSIRNLWKLASSNQDHYC